MSDRTGLHDPGDWYNRWQSAHRSDSFSGRLADLVISTLQDPESLDGLGTTTLAYLEVDGREIVVTIAYLVETYHAGRVFHILSIVSPGDPPPTRSHRPDAGP